MGKIADIILKVFAFLGKAKQISKVFNVIVEIIEFSKKRLHEEGLINDPDQQAK
jgi:hypothetical protein